MKKPQTSIEVEQSVLSCLLQSPSENIPAFLMTYRDGQEMFHDGRYAACFAAAVAIQEAGGYVDPISVSEALKTNPEHKAWADWGFISALLDISPTPMALDYYAQLLEEMHIKRKILNLSLAIEDHLRDETSSQALAWLEAEIMGIAKNRQSSPEETPIKEIVRSCLDLFQAAFEAGGQVTGIPSGISTLDKYTGGFKPGQLVIIAGRPGMGKTSLAMNMAEHAAVDRGIPTGVFSIEMTKEELVSRCMCSLSLQNFETMQCGAANERSIHDLQVHSGRIAKAPIHVQDPSGININQLCARARRMKRKHNVMMLVVDYIGLIAGSGKAENRVREIAQVTNSLKCLAKELAVPILALAQLNRKVEDAGGREPRLSDLRESGSIEQDADLVLFLHADEIQSPEQNMKLILAKHRGGRTGPIDMLFKKQFTRFYEISKVSDVQI